MTKDLNFMENPYFAGTHPDMYKRTILVPLQLNQQTHEYHMYDTNLAYVFGIERIGSLRNMNLFSQRIYTISITCNMVDV